MKAWTDSEIVVLRFDGMHSTECKPMLDPKSLEELALTIAESISSIDWPIKVIVIYNVTRGILALERIAVSDSMILRSSGVSA